MTLRSPSQVRQRVVSESGRVAIVALRMGAVEILGFAETVAEGLERARRIAEAAGISVAIA